jgi:hypothetical protein
VLLSCYVCDILIFQLHVHLDHIFIVPFLLFLCFPKLGRSRVPMKSTLGRLQIHLLIQFIQAFLRNDPGLSSTECNFASRLRDARESVFVKFTWGEISCISI